MKGAVVYGADVFSGASTVGDGVGASERLRHPADENIIKIIQYKAINRTIFFIAIHHNIR